MVDQGIVLLKILALSAAISLLIRYVVPLLNLPDTSAVALVLVLAPPLIVGAMLGWRNRSSQQQ